MFGIHIYSNCVSCNIPLTAYRLCLLAVEFFILFLFGLTLPEKEEKKVICHLIFIFILFCKVFHTDVYSICSFSCHQLFVGVGDGRVLAINSTTSDIIWGPATNNYVASSIAVGADNVVYAGSTDSTVYALSGKDGSVLWKLKTNGSISLSSPVLRRSESMTLG